MSREADNVAVVRAIFDAFNRAGTWDAVLEYMSPDIEMETDPRHPLAGVYRGLDEYRDFLREFEEPYERTIMEPEEVFARGDRVVTFVRARRKPYGSSIEMENRIGFMWTLRDGKVIREQAFGQRERALEAAGMTTADEVAG
jgi:ketosteroid isomerase-like protein